MKLIAQNKKARHDYFILSKYEAGIVLTGTEVKSIREGKVNLKDSYAHIEHGELWLVGTHISPYAQGNINNHDPLRKRKLLMHVREIDRLKRSIEEKGLTLVPLSLYFNGVQFGAFPGKPGSPKPPELFSHRLLYGAAPAGKNPACNEVVEVFKHPRIQGNCNLRSTHYLPPSMIIHHTIRPVKSSSKVS